VTVLTRRGPAGWLRDPTGSRSSPVLAIATVAAGHLIRLLHAPALPFGLLAYALAVIGGGALLVASVLPTEPGEDGEARGEDPDRLTRRLVVPVGGIVLLLVAALVPAALGLRITARNVAVTHGVLAAALAVVALARAGQTPNRAPGQTPGARAAGAAGAVSTGPNPPPAVAGRPPRRAGWWRPRWLVALVAGGAFVAAVGLAVAMQPSSTQRFSYFAFDGPTASVTGAIARQPGQSVSLLWRSYGQGGSPAGTSPSLQIGGQPAAARTLTRGRDATSVSGTTTFAAPARPGLYRVELRMGAAGHSLIAYVRVSAPAGRPSPTGRPAPAGRPS
jgi:hypothetical protein